MHYQRGYERSLYLSIFMEEFGHFLAVKPDATTPECPSGIRTKGEEPGVTYSCTYLHPSEETAFLENAGRTSTTPSLAQSPSSLSAYR